MTGELELLKILADGKLHSGQELADMTGVSRTAIWKHTRNLRDKHIELDSVPGQGYRLSRPIELLDPGRIHQSLTIRTKSCLHNMEIVYETSSTNRVLMDRLLTDRIHGHVLLAEHQTHGRGRGNNRWLAAPASGLIMSFGWHFDDMPDGFPALSLATGVVLASCLKQASGAAIHLKWPNDLIVDGSKLGGILVESRGQQAGSIDVIIGIGINMYLSTSLAKRIGQKTTDLASVCHELPSRNLLAGYLINSIIELLLDYPEKGFRNYIEAWRSMDSIKGSHAILSQSGRRVQGRVLDIDESGNLIMQVDGDQKKFSSGELSLRALE